MKAMKKSLMMRGMVLDVLRSPEGQAVIAQAVRKELKK